MGRISIVVNSQCIRLCPKDIYELAVPLNSESMNLESSLKSQGAFISQNVPSLDVQN